MLLSDIMKEFALSEAEQEEFTTYTANRFEGLPELPPRDMEFLKLWEGIIQYALEEGAAAAINDRVCPARPVEFRSPEGLEIRMFDSFAGKIPIIYVRDAADFEDLVTNVAHKGIRPENISQTGASFLSGKTTRFIILSAKPYSNVPASELGIPEEGWAEQSMLLRREHECTHYYTKQTFGIANNILHDEIMADFIGLTETFGFYKAEWFLRFMGIIEGSGGRLITYTEKLSEKVRAAVSKLLILSSENLEAWSRTEEFTAMTGDERIRLMCRAGLGGMLEKDF